MEYDINVDYDTLCSLEEKLQRIVSDLNTSSQKMSQAIHNGQYFLSGSQFDKAMSITNRCTELTLKTSNNINYAIMYIKKLKAIVEEYNQFKYPEV